MNQNNLTTSSKSDQREYWNKHIQQWQQSNLKQTTYCEQAGISYKSFTYWKSILSSKQKSSHADTKSFVSVKVISDEHSKTSAIDQIQIKLSNGHVVFIPLSMNVERIAALINLLGAMNA